MTLCLPHLLVNFCIIYCTKQYMFFCFFNQANIYATLQLIMKLNENRAFIFGIIFEKPPFVYICPNPASIVVFHCHFICIKYLFLIIK